MSPIAAAIILVTVLVTSFISGIFGMAGGIIFMGVLTALVPVATAMMIHGAGSVLAVGLLFALSWRPDKQVVYVLLGCVAMLVWLPKAVLDLNIQKRFQAEGAGFIVQSLNTIAGVSGPLLDQFFVKIIFWSTPVIAAAGFQALPPWWLILAAAPLSMLGTTFGGRVLDRMSDVNFKRGMKYLVTAIGAVMLLRAAGWL